MGRRDDLNVRARANGLVMPEGTLDRLLEEHGVSYAELEPAALAKAHDAEGLARVVRLAASNRELRKNGLPPLLIGQEEDPLQKGGERQNKALLFGLSPQEVEAVNAIEGLNLELYMCIRGQHGVVLGLRLNERAFRSALGACKGKKAARIASQPEAAQRKFLEVCCCRCCFVCPRSG